MPLGPGTRLGAYEIVSLLGVGGMGEVYRARDPRLQREIALKVLPDIAAADPARRERFRREALSVAALNHPHIVTIHSVEDADSTLFLTMELVSGRSLADALQPGGLPLARVLTIGIAIADAMAAAHQNGITHRDLKPANIMLGEGAQAGRIKVLDFGLAKAIEPGVRSSESGTGNSLTITSPARTQPGVILGTVAYMSPEQAEGRAVDSRSDLFSLGVVLYEMATGQRPFSGDTDLSILSSILRDTPRPVTEINAALPRDFERIVRRALAKDPERRYQDARDLRNDLEDLKALLDSGELTSVPTAGRTMVVRNRSRKLAVAAGALLLGAAALVVWTLSHDATPAAPQPRSTGLSLADFQVTQLTTSGTAERPTISPDGRYVAYVQHDANDYSLWLRQTTTTSNVQIVPPQPGVTLLGATFTPDGTSIDFVRRATGAPAEVWRVPFLGGTPRLFVADVASPISWAPDGRHIAYLRTRFNPTLSSQLMVAAADGGQERQLASDVPAEPWISLEAPWRPSFAPAWSPDGRLIAVAASTLSGGGRVIFVDSENGSASAVAVPSGIRWGLSWLNGESLVLNQPSQLVGPNQLFRLPYPAGPLARLTNDPNDYVGASLSGDGSWLVTARRDVRMDVWVGDGGGATGTEVVRRAPIRGERLADVAWSGHQLLYGTVVSGRPAILRVTPGQDTSEEVVLDALTPGVTSDGRTIVFVSSSTDSFLDLWTAEANGRRVAKLVPSVTAEQVVVTPDDRSVIYISIVGGTVSIWMVPIGGGTPTKLADGGSASVSPDGGSMAFADSRASLIVCALPECASRRTIGSAPFRGPLSWTPDGRGVAYPREGNIWVQPLGGGPPRQLTRSADRRPIGFFAWSRDDKRLAITRTTETNDIVLLRGLK
ncbi:MAG TPA: protein kinase [Vicinamibacterales bacterium]|nr:protein kinase [Vicinamibacterales bacterium]